MQKNDNVMQNLGEKVIKIIADKLGKDSTNIRIDDHFINDLSLDSLDTVELIMEFEKEFDITIQNEEAEKISTVNDVVKLLENKLK
jgi:acyl carrier protein